MGGGGTAGKGWCKYNNKFQGHVVCHFFKDWWSCQPAPQNWIDGLVTPQYVPRCNFICDDIVIVNCNLPKATEVMEDLIGRARILVQYIVIAV